MEQSLETLDKRVGLLEQALIGTVKEPGIGEMQRNQSKEIAGLRTALDGLSSAVTEMADARRTEIDMRKGERKAFQLFQGILYGALAFFAAGGFTIGRQVLAALKEVSK